jgi:hypothetical protein
MSQFQQFLTHKADLPGSCEAIVANLFPGHRVGPQEQGIFVGEPEVLEEHSGRFAESIAPCIGNPIPGIGPERSNGVAKLIIFFRRPFVLPETPSTQNHRSSSCKQVSVGSIGASILIDEFAVFGSRF